MKRLKKRGNKWLVIDLQADTVNEFNTQIAARNFMDGGEIEEVTFENYWKTHIEEKEGVVVETTMGEGRLYGFKT